MSQTLISKAVLQRLSLYLAYLKSLPYPLPDNISATAIASSLGLGDVQVRKDLSVVAGGRPRIGHKVDELIYGIEEALGFHRIDKAVIIGAGRLGRALLEYGGFSEYGIEISAAFDSDASKCIGVVLPMEKLPLFVEREKITIGIITVPASSAQGVLEGLYETGIKRVINFAPLHLSVPEGMSVHNENIAASLSLYSKHTEI